MGTIVDLKSYRANRAAEPRNTPAPPAAPAQVIPLRRRTFAVAHASAQRKAA